MLACYPQRTILFVNQKNDQSFFWVNMLDFHPCNIYKFYNQIKLYHYIQKNKKFLDFIFKHPRYSFGGGRPSQTTNYIISVFILLVSNKNLDGITLLL